MTPSKQRKKTDKEESSKIRSRTTDGDEKISLTEQLDRAQSAVERNHAATLTLHQQWRTQLLRMSYLVMIVTMHMAQTPSGACIKEIKKWNGLQPDTLRIPGSEAIVLILHDSVVELLSFFCAACLVFCLRLPQGDFATLPYRLSCGVIPMILSLHFQASKERPTCVTAASCYDASLTTADLRDEEQVPRHFPVILVFHLIVSISLWFMQYQNQEHDKNIKSVHKLKQDLLQGQKAKVDKKKR